MRSKSIGSCAGNWRLRGPSIERPKSFLYSKIRRYRSKTYLCVRLLVFVEAHECYLLVLEGVIGR